MKVFISFSQSDHRFAHILAAHLVDIGIEPLIATTHVTPGARLDEKVKKMIRQANAIVVLLTPGANRSKWVQQEIGCAKAFSKQIIPVKSKSVRLPAMLEGIEYFLFKRSEPAGDFARVAAFLGDEAEKRGIRLRKSSSSAASVWEWAQILHLPSAVICPHCKKIDNHVAVCLLRGDWVCFNCGETVPPGSRPT
jgi:hypothetical protein